MMVSCGFAHNGISYCTYNHIYTASFHYIHIHIHIWYTSYIYKNDIHYTYIYINQSLRAGITFSITRLICCTHFMAKLWIRIWEQTALQHYASFPSIFVNKRYGFKVLTHVLIPTFLKTFYHLDMSMNCIAFLLSFIPPPPHNKINVC